ncbi:MAG: serine/threonine-protein kinase [Sandaracinaceae bacterium]
MPAPETDSLVGKVLAERYRIESPLGEGGIGKVYRARHLTLGRMVALKVLLTQYENVDVLKQRFAREAEALAALSHPNIVTVTDYGVEGDLPYIVMELLEGRDLSVVIATEPEPLAPKRVFELMRQALRALSYAHDQGLIHRDLKPHNLFVRDLGHGQEHCHVLDFGLARFTKDAASRGPKLTRQGALIGTPAYMAPEQASGEEVDARADIYAMGCVLFEALTGQRVFPSPDPGQILRAHLLSPPPSLSRADPGLRCSPALEALVAKCLEKGPDQRFQTAPEMLEALEALGPQDAERIGPRPPPGTNTHGIEATQGGVRVEETKGATPEAIAEQAGRPSQSAQLAPPHGSTGASIALPTKSRTPLLTGAAVLGALLVGVAVFLGMEMLHGDDGDAPSVATPTPVTPTAVDPPATAPAPADHLPENPLDHVPDGLFSVLHDIEEGESASARSALTDYRRAHPDDPRAQMYFHLLRARLAGEREITEALDQYAAALSEHPDALGDPGLLQRSIQAVCANSARLRSRGERLIQERYGALAADALRTASAASEAERGFRCDNPDHLTSLASELIP